MSLKLAHRNQHQYDTTSHCGCDYVSGIIFEAAILAYLFSGNIISHTKFNHNLSTLIFFSASSSENTYYMVEKWKQYIS